jgi:acetate kinase
MNRRILTMNTGSATSKSALYESGNRNELLLSMAVNHVSVSVGRLKIAGPDGTSLFDSPVDYEDPNGALEIIFAWLNDHGFLSGLGAAGHRLVQGGPRYKDPQRITPEFLFDMQQLVQLDLDHMPAAISGIQFIAKRFPDLPQIACFDTAFHSSLPQVASMYALPRKFFDQGIRRAGFHGLSYEYVMSELHMLEGNLASGRVIIAHLGSGASIAAVKEGKSIDTSMGFTPLEGLVMATRSGDIDPGALLYLHEHDKMSANEMNALLNKESGLLGISGTSGDMKILLETARADARAEQAVALFCYRAKKYIGAYAAVLGGLDLLVFAGGIGEHAPDVRKRICDGLEFLGIRLEAGSNEVNAALISHAKSPVKVRVIKTNEDLMIARHVSSALGWTGVLPTSVSQSVS